MSETGRGGEQLPPAQQFDHIIDGHFTAIGGRGGAEEFRTSQEKVALIFTETDGLNGPPPHASTATRPIPGQEELAKLFWPENYGYRVETFTYPNRFFTIAITYFFSDEALYSMTYRRQAGGLHLYGPLLTNDRWPVRFSPEQTTTFLRCLRSAIPVLPPGRESGFQI